MTANELADLLIIVDALQGNVVLKESATMLRQQAKEIEALKLRELSDEEIDELANKYLYVLNDVPYANDIKDFARAILKCASGNILSDKAVKD